MKTKWRLYIFWSVLALGLLSCAANTYESPFTRRKGVFKPGTPSSSPLSPLSSRRPLRPQTPPTGGREAKIRSDISYLADVSVTCSTSDVVVRVKPSFYGMGADAGELKLGRACKSNGVLRPYGDLIFTYPLTACDAVRESTPGYLLYKSVLHYEPSPKRFPSTAHRIHVDIECRYQRHHHVYQLTVKPTWETAVVSKRLKGSPNDFQMELMDDSWGGPAKSRVYQLGKTVNVQVSVPHLSTGGKLYINSCYATPSSGSTSSHKYSIIDNSGCMLDSKRDPGASQFISRTDKTLRISLKAFQFTSDPDTEVNIHCRLFVTPEDPGPAQKSCTYRGNRWEALTGDDSVCECCDSQCVTFKPRRALMEGSASSGSLLVSDQPYTAEDGFQPVSREGKATIHHYVNEQHSHENLWESADVVKYDDDEEQDYTDEEAEEEEGQHEDEEESGFILGVMTKPELDELGFGERVLIEEKDLNQFEEEGSGYTVQEESEEEEEEVHLNQKEAEVLRHWDQMEHIFPSVHQPRALQPLVSEGEDVNRKHAGGGEKDEGAIVSEVEWKNDLVDDDLTDLVDDSEMTWYFSWR